MCWEGGKSGREVRWENGKSGTVVSWEDEKGGRIVKQQGRRCWRAVTWQVGKGERGSEGHCMKIRIFVLQKFVKR